MIKSHDDKMTPLFMSDLKVKNTTSTPTMTPPPALWAYPMITAP